MTAAPQIGGVICAALTPLDDSLAPDVPAAVAHCRRLLRIGCDGINLLGSTGEATSLSVAQRLAVMAGIAHSGLPIERFMVGTGAASLADAVVLTRAAAAHGFAGALVIPPFYYKSVTVDGVIRYYSELIERTADARLRLYFYNFPQLSGVPIESEAIAAVMAAFPGTIAGLKDSSGNAGYAAALVRAFPSLAIFPSSETILPAARAQGFAGCISASVNVSAPLARALWADDAAPQTRTDVANLRETIVRYPLVPALRHIMAQIDRHDAWLRMLPPLHALTPDQATALDTELSALPAFAHVMTAAAA